MADHTHQVTSNPVPVSSAPITRTRRSGSTRRQDLARQIILLIPLATAAAGSATMQLAQEYVEMLPALFFVGALLITVAMLHQRNILRENQQLTERVQEAHERLDILHRLEVGLNETLDVAQATRTVVEHALLSTDADAAALWLNPRFNEAADQISGFAGRNWTLVAAQGWSEAGQERVLEACHSSFNGQSGAITSHMLRVQGQDDDSKILADVLSAPASAIVVPIRWKNEAIGALMALRCKGPFDSDDAVLLDAMALVSGPSLENALLYETAAARADIDGLTGLYNHRAVQERFMQEVARAQRAADKGLEEPLSLILMDLTDFKIFNDTYGHGVGDDVLRTVADCLRENFRASDIVARYGGDEFVALLPETDALGAQTLAQRLIKALEAKPFSSGDDSRILIRLACGISTFPDDARNGAELFEAADARMYEAKHRGTALVKHVGQNETSATVRAGQDGSAGGPRVLSSEALNQLWKSFGVLDTLITAIDNRDRYTRRHSEQVMNYALLIAQEMELSPEMLDAVRTCGLLHDVGKVAVPDAILRKPGRLSQDETRLMQQHTEFGAMIIRNVPHLDRVLEGVRSHHEAFDGSGYPDALTGDTIPLMGRLLAVPVCFSAMTTDRPYRKALSTSQALEEIAAGRGTQFDPDVVDAFLRAMSTPAHMAPSTTSPALDSIPEVAAGAAAR